MELYKAPTDKLQAWHQPKPKTVTPLRVKDVYPVSVTSVTMDADVDYNSLAHLPQTSPIFGVITMPHKEPVVEKVFRTLSLPAFAPAGYGRLATEYTDPCDVIFLL